MASGGFESERSLEARKERRRREREALLVQAKADYEKDKRRKELKRLRGEDTWMLPDVNKRVEELEKEHSVKKKKKKDKHSRKLKKEKKKSKNQKFEKNDDSSDSSSGSSVEWVESTISQSICTEKAWKVKKEQSDTTENPAVQRDEWMTLDFMSLKTMSAASLKADKETEKLLEQQKAQTIEQSRLSERELNPYWKDGGTGLPPEEGEATSVKKVKMVEDGGLSWLKKSYQRMKEQAEREKRNFEEIVAERYGSVEIFQSRWEEAEEAASKQENEYRKGRWRKFNYSKIEKKDREHHMEKETHDEGDRIKGTCEGHSRDRHNKVYPLEERGYRKDTSREEQEYRQCSTDSEFRDNCYKAAKHSDAKQSQETVSSLSNLKYKFLKPSEDDFSSVSKDYKLLQSSLKLPSCSSLSSNFQKPGKESEEKTPWSRTHIKDENEKPTLDQKPLKMEKTTYHEGAAKAEREKTQEENLGNIPKKKVLLPDSKASYSGHTPKDVTPQALSEEEMNRLGAKIVKAELMGNLDLASKLQAQLENARKLKESRTETPARPPEKEAASLQEDHEVILVRTDQSGRAWPVNTMAEPLEPKGGRRKRQMGATHIDKERVRYFQDDDDLSLKDLVKNEKMRTAEDQNSLFMRMASKFSEKSDREYYTLDDMFVSKAAKGERSGEEEERHRRKAIYQHHQLVARMEKCPYCFDSPELPKHLIIAIGIKVFLSLPNYQSLTEGHCVIAPLQHYTAATLLDEDIWEEIQMFRKALVKMFESKELDCVFLETNMSIKKRYHMVYECIPLPKELGDMAPIYFKKAILESDEEWSMNKKLIDLSSRDVRKSIPRGLPYFSVDFGLQGGFAHVIEDQHKFPHYFGKEIIGGMLDLEPRLWKKGIRENFDDQRKKVLQFAQWWKPYDITKTKE
ncbi:CWF19-like protein 2 isoform X1 [Chelonia mydas]|uniref:CWF19-like protein 2 isoform X1 n=2 Tax=Chelonia mydas TaxID=8469 RepID=UPI0018A1CE01|nr:CWF19-like protein 2 isoform X1 [Chelonia mydas]XP_043385715.1 CWF19-like protein 2 isoform X1 [Chelonia mydas]